MYDDVAHLQEIGMIEPVTVDTEATDAVDVDELYGAVEEFDRIANLVSEFLTE